MRRRRLEQQGVPFEYTDDEKPSRVPSREAEEEAAAAPEPPPVPLSAALLPPPPNMPRYLPLE